MGGGAKTLSVALAALLFAAGLGACGSGDDSGSTAAETASRVQPAQAAGGEGSSQGEAQSGKDAGEGAEPAGSADSDGSFEPRQHEDSGGGSEQFRVQGGDNSVQGFGEEAGESELDAAATALHNFLDARALGEWEAACSYLARGIAGSLEEFSPQASKGSGVSCAVGLENMTNPAGKAALLAEAKRVDVGSLRIEGDNAFVIYDGVEGDTPFAIPMIREGGAWKVAALAGGPIA